MRAGVILGSALAGAAAAAVMTLDKKEKEKVMDFLSNVKDKVVDLAEDLKDKLPSTKDVVSKAKEVVGKAKDVIPEARGVAGVGAKESKGRSQGRGIGNSKPAQSLKGMKGGRATAAKKTGRKSGR